ncbi:hypothetical protein D3C74_49370 [compost metagenome]
MFKLIVGHAGSGKSHKVAELAVEAATQKRNVVIFVSDISSTVFHDHFLSKYEGKYNSYHMAVSNVPSLGVAVQRVVDGRTKPDVMFMDIHNNAVEDNRIISVLAEVYNIDVYVVQQARDESVPGTPQNFEIIDYAYKGDEDET